MAYRVAAGIFLATMPRQRAQKYIDTFLKPAAILLTSVVIRDLLFSQLAARDFVLIGFQSIQISLGSLLRFVSLVAAYYLAAVVLSALAQQLLRRVNVEQGVQATTINIMRYSIFGIGVLLALSLFGLDLTTLAVVFGGLSVGIGFGLNELISNVISGILLAFERLIRPGDTIEVGGVRGVVTEVRMRSTILRTFDRVQVIVPNKNMLTSVVSAFTSWETTVSRLSLQVSVDFQTDPERVRSILLNLVTGHPKVLREPTPSAIVTAIGPYSIEIQIFAFVAEFYQTFSVRSELYAMIWEEFRRLGIAIPYPRQEVMMNGPLDAGDSSLSAGSVPATDA
jgi:small-conductance mechanosensitive channel